MSKSVEISKRGERDVAAHPVCILCGGEMEVCDWRDEKILSFLETIRQRPRCDWCGKEFENAPRAGVRQEPTRCSACQRARCELRRVDLRLRDLPKDAVDFDRSTLERERNSREWVLELRKGYREDLDGIFNFGATSTADLERELNGIRRSIGGKEDLYGQLGNWFSDAQIKLLRYLIWQARATDSGHLGLKRARGILLREGRVPHALE